MVQVKICGVCRPEDAALIAGAGADYLGVILAPGGKRSRTELEAAAIYAAAPGCRRVGVFVDEPRAALLEKSSRLGLDIIQLHGSESPEYIGAIREGGWQLWKVLRPRSAEEFLEGVELYSGHVDKILLDGWSSVAPGGTGSPFPWAEIAGVRHHLPPGVGLVIAGGLDPDNLGTAIEHLSPEVVDVSSGVESAVGVKDHILVEGFIAAARKV